MDKSKIGTFVLGGIAGALAGILLAPRSGRELRGSIASRAGEARERGRETYFDAQELARERLSEVRDRPPPAPPEDAVAPRLAPRPPEPTSGPPPLRDVSRGATEEPAVQRERAEDPEELRRRIREMRSRLRERVDGPEGPSGKGDG